jgi:type IV secretory pathway TrbD component
MADHVGATFWYVLPSLPMFLTMPMLIRSGANFWLSLLAGCLLTIALYTLMTWIGPRFGLKL